MKSPLPIRNHGARLYLLLFLCLSTAQFVASQRCEFEGAGGVVEIVSKDDVLHEEQVWEGTLPPEVSSVALNPNQQVFDFLTVHFEVDSGSQRVKVTLHAKQPAFGDYLDFTGNQALINDNAVLITYNDNTGGSCRVQIFFEDGNNKSPEFNRTSSDPLEFSISKSWNKDIALNWKYEHRIRVTDYDHTSENARVFIITSEDSVIEGRVKETTDMDLYPNRFIFDVELFLVEDKDIEAGTYEIIASDGVNNNTLENIEVVISIVEENLFPPVFEGTGYCVALDSMPSAGEIVSPDITARDDDGDMIYYGVDSEYLEFDGDQLPLRYKGDIGALKGTELMATVTANDQNPVGEKKDEKTLRIKFPEKKNPEFSENGNFYYDEMEDWDQTKQDMEIAPTLSATAEDGEVIKYSLVDPAEAPFVDDSGNKLVFNVDVTEDNVGVWTRNRVVVFRVKAEVEGDEERAAIATVILAFPMKEEATTTTMEPCVCTTLEPPECTPEPCECSSTQMPETTVTSETTMSEATTPCDCSQCPSDPCPTTIDPPTTCLPPDYTPPPCDCTTPETPETPPTDPCPTTIDPPATCPPPPPCECTPETPGTTPETPGTTSGDCPVCPIDPCPTTIDPPTTCLPPDYTPPPCDCTTDQTPETCPPPVCPTTVDPPTTCLPPDYTPPPCDCSTSENPDNPTTPGDCPVCPIEPCPTTIDPPTTCLPPDYTPPPCDCSTSENPDNPTTPGDCPVCPIEPCPTTLEPPRPSTCPECPENPTCPTVTCPNCPTQEPCGECPTEPPNPCPTCPPCGDDSTCPPCSCDDDCSTAGFIAGIVTTSILFVASVSAAGYLFYVLRKNHINPFDFSRSASPTSHGSGAEANINSFASSPPPPVNPLPPSDPTSYNPNRFPPSANGTLRSRNLSFGESPDIDTFSTEPGVTNPTFNAEEPALFQPSSMPIEEPIPFTSSAPYAAPLSSPSAEIPSSSFIPEPTSNASFSAVPVVDPVSASPAPVKKSNIKPPKEIEPDYEGAPAAAAVIDQPAEEPQRKASRSRVLFAPEDEYISIDDDVGNNDATAPTEEKDVESESDYEDERL